MIDLSTYHLTFSDEFNSLSASATGQGTTWATTRPGSILSPGIDIGYGLTAFVDSSRGIQPLSVSNGALTIETAPATAAIAGQIGGATWTSGLLQSINSFSQTYGYFEIRAQLPAEPGTWPAFWMLAANGQWPPEIDVFETYGADPTGLSNTVHTATNGTAAATTLWSSQPTITSGFHTFGALWTASAITFYYDDSPVARIATPADAHTPIYPVISLAMTGAAGLQNTPKTMQVDYVRIYSADASRPAIDLGPVSSPDGLQTADLHGASTLTSPGGVNPDALLRDTLTIRISGDSWNGPPQFFVSVDGKRVGDIYDVTALHSAGQWQDISIKGNFGSGSHDVTVTYLNDANQSPYFDASSHSFVNDRNLFVSSVTLNGSTYGAASVTSNSGNLGFTWLDPSAAVMAGNGAATFHLGGVATVPTPPPPTTPPTSPSTPPEGSVVLHVSGDTWNGPPQFVVSVDGKQVGGSHDVTALHRNGQWQDIAVDAPLDGAAHTISITYLNDGNQGAYYDPPTNTFVNDRNIFIGGLTVNGSTYGKTAISANTAASGFDWLDPSAAVMAANGTVTYRIPATSGSPTAPVTPATPPPLPASGGDQLSIHLSGDSWNGPPQFRLKIDGQQVGGPYDVAALHGQHQRQDIAVPASLGSGHHTVEIDYINDANSNPYYDPAVGFVNDRNLFIDSIEINGTIYGRDHVVSNSAEIGFGWLDSAAMVMAANGALVFQI